VANLRCTGRLLKRLKQRPAEFLSEPDNTLGDWYANILNIGRNRLVMVTSERTLLTVVVPFRDSKRLRERIRESVHELLFALGVPPALAAEEVHGMDRMPFGKTASRSVLGSMNDMAIQARAFFEADDEEDVVYPNELHIYLNDIPCGPLDYSSPIRATREAFGLHARGGPEWMGRGIAPRPHGMQMPRAN
jgi:hypothetical protein